MEKVIRLGKSEKASGPDDILMQLYKLMDDNVVNINPGNPQIMVTLDIYFYAQKLLNHTEIFE